MAKAAPWRQLPRGSPPNRSIQPVECIDRSAMIGTNDGFGPAIVKLAAAPGWEPTFVFRLGTKIMPTTRSSGR
jgi:hypothetical protein